MKTYTDMEKLYITNKNKWIVNYFNNFDKFTFENKNTYKEVLYAFKDENKNTVTSLHYLMNKIVGGYEGIHIQHSYI